MDPARPVAYFDGQCNVCNRFVDFCLRHDREGRLLFAPLQGSTAKARLPRALVDEKSTMALQNGGTLEVESTAAIHTLILLGGPFRLMAVFLLVPSLLRDIVYRFVANHRYLFAKRSETCRVPTEAERERFLN